VGWDHCLQPWLQLCCSQATELGWRSMLLNARLI